jgi:alpha-tubulin suppressor-like RCC1 family protein
MLHLGRIPPLLAPRARGGRVPRLPHRLAFVLAPALVVGALGCGNDDESPTGLAAEPALVTGAVVGALVFRQVDAGTLHTCAITAAGKAWCWGGAGAGELGDGKWPGSLRPVAVAGGLTFLEIRAGTSFSCGLATDNRAYCWGANQFGQLADGIGVAHDTPTPVADGRRFRQLHPGLNHTCALNFDDVAFCWGQNDAGQLGDGTKTNRNKPVRVQGGLRFKQIRAGGGQSCGLTAEGRAYCWGINNAGQLGDGTTTQRLTPVAVTGGHVFTSLSVGGASACAITSDNRGWCWGLNNVGQLADGSSLQRRVRPVVVADNRRFIGISEGDDHGCGILIGGSASCWGSTFNGAVGDGTGPGTSIEQRVPVPVVNGTAFTPINSGPSHTCALNPDGHAYCWGWNAGGQLGDGTTQDRSVPVAVLAP